MLGKKKAASELCKIINIYPQVLINAKVASNKRNIRKRKRYQNKIQN